MARFPGQFLWRMENSWVIISIKICRVIRFPPFDKSRALAAILFSSAIEKIGCFPIKCLPGWLTSLNCPVFKPRWRVLFLIPNFAATFLIDSPVPLKQLLRKNWQTTHKCSPLKVLYSSKVWYLCFYPRIYSSFSFARWIRNEVFYQIIHLLFNIGEFFSCNFRRVSVTLGVPPNTWVRIFRRKVIMWRVFLFILHDDILGICLITNIAPWFSIL